MGTATISVPRRATIVPVAGPRRRRRAASTPKRWPARGRRRSACRRAARGRGSSSASRSPCAPRSRARARPDAAEPRVAEGVGLWPPRVVCPCRRAAWRPRRRRRSRSPPAAWRRRMCSQTSSTSNGPLGHEDDVGAAGHARVGGDPAGMAAHDLHDHDAVVGLRRGVQPVDRVGGDLHRGVEAEGVVGAGKVVVDRLGHADDRHAVSPTAGPPRPACPRRRSGRARRCRGAPASRARPPCRRRRPWKGLVREVPRIVPAAVQDPARLGERELDRLAVDHPGPAVAEAEESWPCAPTPSRTTARITALRPGQSPPPVRTPMRDIAGHRARFSGRRAGRRPPTVRGRACPPPPRRRARGRCRPRPSPRRPPPRPARHSG